MELFQVYMTEERRGSLICKEDPEYSELALIPECGMSFLHLAVEHNSYNILAYLLLDQKISPNSLSGRQVDMGPMVMQHDLSEMAILHMAIYLNRI